MVLHVMLGELVSLNMSNGVGEGGRSQSREKRKLFSMQWLRFAKSVEVTMYKEPALDTLIGIAVQYIYSIGKTAQLYASIAGIAEGISLDIVQALEGLGSGSGILVTYCCLADVVKDIIRYSGEAEEMPFVYARPCFYEVGAEPPDEHIPVSRNQIV
ncbi:unnamed protein product [Eruca vesicaria subsp. sativa]|uniref:Bromodomain associated domain-containing protein n=1 Tax=Eruca vesicaria subsp. sativa TaxID=29727 RepID=A0ABC8LQE6_ERUVS|nr:unnamed protein product [Eruca vesicaria subsp. sativa]